MIYLDYVATTPLDEEIRSTYTKLLTNYFANSEQTNSAVTLGVLVDKNGVRASGGYLINPMPNANSEQISKVEKGARSREYIGTVDWLKDAGIIFDLL